MKGFRDIKLITEMTKTERQLKTVHIITIFKEFRFTSYLIDRCEVNMLMKNDNMAYSFIFHIKEEKNGCCFGPDTFEYENTSVCSFT